jgi:hypothetical protein
MVFGEVVVPIDIAVVTAIRRGSPAGQGSFGYHDLGRPMSNYPAISIAARHGGFKG